MTFPEVFLICFVVALGVMISVAVIAIAIAGLIELAAGTTRKIRRWFREDDLVMP
jgi:hypothetical protein